jgi:hypothetical protein
MANQMIALQARNPQLPDPSRAAAQYANMMNMATQQRASQLQGERIRQEMEFARAKEGREVDMQAANIREKELDIEDKELLRLYKIGAAILETEDPTAREAAYQNLLGQIEKTSPQLGATMRQVAGTFNPQVLQSVMVPVVDHFNKKYTTPTTEIIFGPNNEVLEATKGGLPGVAGVRPLLNMPAQGAPAAAPRATPTAPQTPTGPARTGKFGEALVVPEASVPLTADQQDHIRRMQEDLGMTNTPASFSAGASAGQMTPQRAQQVVDAAVKTGMMAQADFDQLMALAPEQNRQPFMEMIRANNIKLQPGGMGQQSQFADLRGPAPQSQTAGLRGAPPMEQTLAQTNVLGQQAYGRSGSPTSPLPGSSQVPLSRLGAEKTTETQAAENVRLKMAPAIATATKKAENAIELKSTATKAKYASEALLNELADRINTIDRLLRNPDRFSIVGPIEGNLPRLLQTGARADAQAAFDKIKNTATLTSLIDMRKSTETGASPVGANPTDKDAKIVEQAASEFIQTGQPSKFDANLIDMRRKLYRTFQSAQREHEGVYADVLKDNPKLRLAVPKVSDRYLSTKDLPKQKTPVKTPTSRLSAETRAKYGL